MGERVSLRSTFKDALGFTPTQSEIGRRTNEIVEEKGASN